MVAIVVNQQEKIQALQKEETDRLGLIVNRIAVSLFAVTPILQHYKGIYQNAAVTVLILLFPYVILKLLNCNNLLKGIQLVMPLIIYHIYQIIDHGTSVTEIGKTFLFIALAVAISNECFDSQYFIKFITAIAVMACFLIIIQYFCYYVLHFHLQLVPTSLLLPRSQQWIKLAQTGRYSISGKMIKFYRPSAFFLEPSHMFIYMFTPAAIKVLSAVSARDKRISVLLLLGMVLTTSGMGILTAILLFGLYLGKTGGSDRRFSFNKIIRLESLLTITFFGLVFIVACVKVPFLRNSVERILGSGADYSNAVTGRLDSGWKLIATMRGTQLLFGVQENLSGVTASLSGFNEAMYQYGIIGVILSYVFFVKGLFTQKNEYFWVAVIVFTLSFFSQHTHSTMLLIYTVFVFTEGLRKQREMNGSKNPYRKAYIR